MAVKRWGRTALVVVVLLLPVAVIAAVGAASGGDSDAPSDEVGEREPQVLPAVPVPFPPPVAAGGAVAVPPTIPGGAEGEEAVAVGVQLHHCGFEPIEALGRAWIVEPAPFDETTVPDDFAGTGVLTANGDGTATYVDDSGVVVELTERPPDHVPPPCD